MSNLKTDELIVQLTKKFGDWDQGDYENRYMGAARFTQELYPYDKLFSPIQCNRLTIKNRTVMAPMGNCQMAEETGRPSIKMQEYFWARAAGGVGLLTTGLIPVSHGIDASVTERGHLSYFPRIDRSRTALMGWRDLAKGVHARGSHMFVQLTPGLGRVGSPECFINKFLPPVSASINPDFYIPEVPCRPLTDFECDKIIKNAGQAAANAKFCGLDGVYLHGHEGYLLDQMTSRSWNHRKTGKYKDWQRFGLELIKEIRRRVGPFFPIMYRIDLSCALNETYGERMKTVKSLRGFTDQRSVADTLDYMTNLVKAGVDMFDVDLGCYDNWWLPHPPSTMPAGCFLDVSKTAKEYFKSIGLKSNLGIDVPIVAVGKLGYPDMAEQALRDGMCDMVMLGRPVLADPDWCKKAYAGKVDEIRPCIGCQEGCVNEFVDGGHPGCAVNARTGYEELIPAQLPKAEKAKKIAVVGGGPAGMNFAIYAADRGHKVELFEAEDQLGGKLLAAGRPIVKYDVDNYLRWLIAQCGKRKSITIKLNTRADVELLKKGKYDVVVYANGAKDFAAPRIPGWGDIPSVVASDVMIHPEKLPDVSGKKVVVIGGGQVGCECAWWLKSEKNCPDVTVVEMLPYFMDGACTANRGWLIHYLEERGVKLMNMTKAIKVYEGRLFVEQNVSKNKPDGLCTWTPILPFNVVNPMAKKPGPETVVRNLDVDLIVVAMGGRADEQPFIEGQTQRVAPEVYNIGDSFFMSRVLEANRAAFNLAMNI